MLLALIILLCFVPAFIYAAIVYWLDRFEKEPLRLLVSAFLWGALVSTIGAIIWASLFEASVYFATGSEAAAGFAGTVLIAPLVEESLKGLAVLIIFLAFPQEFDTLLDGIVYGAIVGLGFAATENVLYLLAAYDEGGAEQMMVLWVVRVVLGAWGHAVYTSCTGIGCAVARQSRSGAVRFFAVMAGWLCAIFLHALHNGMATLLAANLGGLAALLLVDWTGWAIMLSLAIWAIFRERRWIRTYLAEEVERGLISPAQYRAAGSIRGQIRARFRAAGPARGITRRFYQTCAELAQKKHQLARYGEERANSAIVEVLRAELANLSAAAAA